jgi:hypothetical protein
MPSTTTDGTPRANRRIVAVARREFEAGVDGRYDTY